ncbi:hypothetical protein PLICRDRAFT_162015 [Plicaturopsis crispa FD-325 SS-3]|nr:hypothetical protein PLICRDRAFT_162015 [Plicaturopsis crispa FD-325 SS-3]
MSRVLYRPTPLYTAPLRVGKPWAASLAVWGVGGATAALFLLSVTPLVKREFLSKVPVLGSYYQDKTPDSDKPF